MPRNTRQISRGAGTRGWSMDPGKTPNNWARCLAPKKNPMRDRSRIFLHRSFSIICRGIHSLSTTVVEKRDMGRGGKYFHRFQAGIPVIVAAPSRIPRPVAPTSQTDRLDGRKRAEYAASGMRGGPGCRRHSGRDSARPDPADLNDRISHSGCRSDVGG